MPPSLPPQTGRKAKRKFRPKSKGASEDSSKHVKIYTGSAVFALQASPENLKQTKTPKFRSKILLILHVASQI